MTGEHLWPEWMHPFLPKLEDPKKEEFYRIVRGKYAPSEIMHDKPQQGHTYTKTIRAVCRICNNGWMNAVEEATKPILIPMLQGQSIELSTEQKRRLAEWITLKMLVVDNQNVADRVIQDHALSFFRLRRTIPRGTKIWIAHHDTPEWYAGYGGQAIGVSLLPERPVLRGLKNVQATAFGVGHMFALTYLTTFPAFEIKLDAIEEMGIVSRLWPQRPRTISWPMRTVSGSALQHLSHIVEHIMRAPISEWRA
jgi:hypothetical protein